MNKDTCYLKAKVKAEPGEAFNESTQGKDCDPGGWNAEISRGLEEELRIRRGD